MKVCDRISFLIFVGVFLTSSMHGQYRTKTYDISKSITMLKSTEFGYLQYGTTDGELGFYDGIILDRKHHFDGSIIDIHVDKGKKYILTSKGLYQLNNDKKILASANNLHILDCSEDLKTLVTTAGIFDKSSNDYVPNREEFYDLNEVKKGRFYEVGGKEFLWMDRTILEKEKSWREFILHPKSDISVISQNDKLIISDDNALVSFDNNGSVDTLLRTDSIGTTKIFPIGSSELLYCADNQIGVFNTRSRELTNVRELNTELVNAVTIDKWENIWVAAGSYLYQIIDTKNVKSQDPPQVRISSIKVNGNIYAKDKTVSLDRGNNDLKISFEGIHLTAPQELVYQTRLTKSNNIAENQESNKWTKPNKIKEAEYRNLTAGKYRFQVRATVDGKYHTYAKTIDIRVNDDTVQYYWLAGLLGALGVLLTAAFFNARYNRLKEKSNQERKLLVQENKMLSLQQKALQLQMNPHFVFNALNSIQGLIAKEDNKKARRYLQQFSSMMRSVLNQSRQETISLDDEVAYLKSYLSLEQMANNDSFDYSVAVTETVEDGISIPTMIVQPFIENAIIHGVKGLKEKRGRIEVIIDQVDDKIICTISDNGQGRKIAAKNKVSTHKSVAIDVVNERLKSKGIKRNPVAYIDHEDGNGNPQGTDVKITIPIS